MPPEPRAARKTRGEESSLAESAAAARVTAARKTRGEESSLAESAAAARVTAARKTRGEESSLAESAAAARVAAARKSRGDESSRASGAARAAGGGHASAHTGLQQQHIHQDDQEQRAPLAESATVAWLGFQAVAVVVRVLVVVGLSLGLFLCVFLGYITLPLMAPALLGVGYVAVQIGRKVLRSR
jgi:hypothetical protein